MALFVLDGQGRFMLLKRRGSHGEGMWGLVGGHVEFGQTPQEAAAMEAFEEVGLRVSPDAIALGPYTSDVFWTENKHYFTLFCSTSKPEGWIPENREPHKCGGFDWFGFDALPSPLFLPVRNLLSTGSRPPFPGML